MINRVQSLSDRGGYMHIQQVTIINNRDKSGLNKLLSSQKREASLITKIKTQFQFVVLCSSITTALRLHWQGCRLDSWGHTYVNVFSMTASLFGLKRLFNDTCYV